MSYILTLHNCKILKGYDQLDCTVCMQSLMREIVLSPPTPCPILNTMCVSLIVVGVTNGTPLIDTGRVML